MCSPEANLGKEPRQAFVLQLREAVEEWRLRHQYSARLGSISMTTAEGAALWQGILRLGG
jgi:hypothetical protein